MKRNLSIVVALGAAFVMGPACGKEKKAEQALAEAKSTTAEELKVTASNGDMPVVPAALPSAMAATDLLKHLPADTEIMLSFSMSSLSASPLWKKIGPAAMASAGKELAQVQESCGFAPLERLRSVVIGVNSSKEQEPVMIVDGFGRDELSKCISAIALKEGEKITITQEGAFTVVTSDRKNKNMTLAWSGPNTMIMVPESANKEFLQARLDGESSLKENEAFVAAAAKANQTAPIWFAAAFKNNSQIAKSLGQLGQTPAGLYGSLGLATGLDLDVGVIFSDAKAATSTLNKAKPFLALARAKLGANAALLDKLELATAGADMVMSLELSEMDLDTLQAMAGPMLGGFGK